MTSTQEMAEFVLDTRYGDLDSSVRDEIKKRILDSIAIGLGAVGEDPPEVVRKTIEEVRGGGSVTLWGVDETASPELATMYNSALVRYLDFMDAYQLPGEAPHPSANIAPAIAMGEYLDKSGEDLITAIGIGYEIYYVMGRYAAIGQHGWDHGGTYTNFSAAGVAGKLLELEREQMMDAISISGVAHNALRNARKGNIPMWKGVISGNAGKNAVFSTFLAKNGMTGPRELFDGRRGFKEVVSGEFDAVYTNCTAVEKVLTKKYMAGTWAQPALAALDELLIQNDIRGEEIAEIDVYTFSRAKSTMGGTGTVEDSGDRYDVSTREEADHSLPFTMAALALDRELTKQQYELERIHSNDILDLMNKITITEDPDMTQRHEGDEMPSSVTVITDTGASYHNEKAHYEGHPNEPMTWERVEEKFIGLTDEYYNESQQSKVITIVKNIQNHSVNELTELL